MTASIPFEILLLGTMRIQQRHWLMPWGRRGRFAAALLAGALLLCGALVSGSPAAGPAAGHWSRQRIAGQPAQLFGVSCSSPTACTAVGDRSRAGSGHLTPLAERWDGRRWRIQRTSPRVRDYLYSVSCPTAAACLAVGSSNLAERWDGRRWSVHRVPHANGYLWGVSCSSATACMAVGTQINPATHRSVPLAARWNGRQWSVQRMPNPSYSKESWLQAVSCPSRVACTAVGFAGFGDGNAKLPLVERWDGHRWSLQQAPSPTGTNESELQGVSCRSAGACTAVGDYVHKRTEMTLAERWDGQTWSVQRTRNPDSGGGPLSGDYLYRVSCSSSSSCTAVGGAGGPAGTITLAEHWNGQRWSVQHTPHPPSQQGSDLSGVACSSPTDCIAVGSYDNWHGPGIPLAERYA